MDNQVSMTWSEFVDFFKPIRNIFGNDPHNTMFETYGRELDYVKAQDPHYVWTYVDGDMCSVTVEGFHYVNRIGYYVTEVPWLDGTSYEIDLQPEICDNCEEPFDLDDTMHDDGLCDNCCKEKGGCGADDDN